MADGGHFVDFFESEATFVAAAASFLGEGIERGCSCIAAFTASHFDALSTALQKRGLDMQQLIDEYRLVALDAEEFLTSVWLGDRLDVVGFYTRVGDLIRLVSAGDRNVRIVGEIAGLLAQRGHFEAVTQVEELCNDLSREHVFQMYCLYSVSSFIAPLDAAARRRLCATHSGSLRA